MTRDDPVFHPWLLRPIHGQAAKDAADRAAILESLERLAAHGAKLEWAVTLADLDRVQEVELAQQGKRVIMRTPLNRKAGKLFPATCVALPPVYREIEPVQET